MFFCGSDEGANLGRNSEFLIAHVSYIRYSSVKAGFVVVLRYGDRFMCDSVIFHDQFVNESYIVCLMIFPASVLIFA